MKKITLSIILTLVLNTFSYGQCWRSISAGYSNFFAIAENGTLWAWGRNSNGELGDGTNIQRTTPVQIGTDTNWKEISASIDGIFSFTLAVKTDGTLWTWGSNNRGQLGDGTTTNRNFPLQIGTDTNWKTVSAGLTHSIGIKQNGTLWGWGSSERFALIGFPSGPNVLAPEQRSMDTNWRQASAHDRVTVAVKTNNTVWCWGYNENGFLDVAFGATIANNIQVPTPKLNTTNILYTNTGDRTSIDVRTNNLLVNPGDLQNNNPLFVKAYDIGEDTSAYIRLDNNTLWSSGDRLGSLTQVIETVQLGTANNWKSVNVGGLSAGAINNNGDLYVWGSNQNGQLGNGTSGPTTTSFIPILVACPSALSNQDFQKSMKLKLYPNPANDQLTIEFHSMINHLIIYDILGKEVLNQHFTDTTATIDVSSFSKGTYILKNSSNSDENEVIKFIKE
jgi:alpha-tubulin suppressor-like RCC1 family protein